MSHRINPLGYSLLPCPDFQSFKKSCMTLIEDSSSLVPDVPIHLCVSSAVSGRDILFVDGWNSFNPYAFSKIAKPSGAEPKKALSRIHVARAFTEYQMDALIRGFQGVLERWDHAVLAVSYPSKKLVRIIDDGCVFEYMTVPPGQMRFDDFDFIGGDLLGQNSVVLSNVA